MLQVVSISSQYSDLRNEFSKYSRPRSGKDDDWRVVHWFLPRSRGRAVSRGLLFGGRPSTRGSLGDLEYNMSGDGEEEYDDDDEASHASDIENEDLDAIKADIEKMSIYHYYEFHVPQYNCVVKIQTKIICNCLKMVLYGVQFIG